jgi:hypothetical protein
MFRVWIGLAMFLVFMKLSSLYMYSAGTFSAVLWESGRRSLPMERLDGMMMLFIFLKVFIPFVITGAIIWVLWRKYYGKKSHTM